MPVHADTKVRGRVWDPFVRLFHWSLVAAFATAWWGLGENNIHETAGKIVLLLIILRAAWGIIGPGSARFENFLKGPRSTLAYVVSIMRGKPAHYLGHNPAGAAMIGLMLLTLATTAASGILMTTTALWGGEWTEWIHGWSAYAMLALIAGHLLGILAAAIQHRENLVWSMVTGRKWVPAGTRSHLGKMKLTRWSIAGAVLAITASAAAWNGSTGLLNASYWRMPKILAAELAKNGCEGVVVTGPRAEVYPERILYYQVSSAQSSLNATLAIPLSAALERRPELETDPFKSLCPGTEPVVAQQNQPAPPVELGTSAAVEQLANRITRLETEFSAYKQASTLGLSTIPSAFRQATEAISLLKVPAPILKMTASKSLAPPQGVSSQKIETRDKKPSTLEKAKKKRIVRIEKSRKRTVKQQTGNIRSSGQSATSSHSSNNSGGNDDHDDSDSGDNSGKGGGDDDD